MRILRRLALLTLLLAAAAVLLPASAGGGTAYITTYGNSMEPGFVEGDLAVVRAAADYQVGDVVAYRSPQLDRIVLHRIVDRDGGGWVFQGDNNTFRDAEHLTAEHIVGRLALRVPRGGSALRWLRVPLNAVGTAVGVSVLPALVIHRRRRTRHARPTRGVPMAVPSTIRLRPTASVLAALAAVLLSLAGYAFTTPTTERADVDVHFTESAAFAYAARSSSSLYPAGFTTGDPVFIRLAEEVRIELSYRLESDAPISVEGGIEVEAVLSGAGGWERTVSLHGPRPLTGDLTVTDAVLHLPTMAALAREAEAATGTAAGEVRIRVVPIVDLDGTVAGRPIEAKLEPGLDLILDSTALRPAAPTGEGDPFQHRSERTVTSPASERALLTLPGMRAGLPVSTARIAGSLAGATFLLLAAAALLAARFGCSGHHDVVPARHRHLVVPIRNSGNGQHRSAIDVATIADLLRVARHHDQMVLHQTGGGRPTYLVEVQGTVYRYHSSDDDPSDCSDHAGADATTVARKPGHAGRCDLQRT